MKTEESLKIGERVKIEVLNKDGYAGPYTSKIDDIIENKKILLGIPTEKGMTIPLKVGDKVSIQIIRKDGVYSFDGSIIERENYPYPYFSVEYPEEVSRAQRRKHVRLKLKIDLSYFVISNEEENEKHEKFTTIDISAGGCCFQSYQNLDMGKKLSISFTLPNGISCENINAEIKRKELPFNKNQYIYGLEFIDMPLKLREKIISYFFELQRTRKNKGLDL